MSKQAKRGQAGIISGIVIVMATLMAVALAMNYMDSSVFVSNKKAEAVSDMLTLKSIMDTGKVKPVYYYNDTSGVLEAWIVYDVPEPIRLDVTEVLVNLSSENFSKMIVVANNTEHILSNLGFVKVLEYNITNYTGGVPVNVSIIGLKLGLSYRKASTGIVLNSTRSDEPVSSNNFEEWLGGNGSGTSNSPGSNSGGTSSGSNGGNSGSGGNSSSGNNGNNGSNTGEESANYTYLVKYESEDRSIKVWGSIEFKVLSGYIRLINNDGHRISINPGDKVDIIAKTDYLYDSLSHTTTPSRGTPIFDLLIGEDKFSADMEYVNVALYINGEEVANSTNGFWYTTETGGDLDINVLNSDLNIAVKHQPEGKTELNVNETPVIVDEVKDSSKIVIEGIKPWKDGLKIEFYPDEQEIGGVDDDNPVIASHVSIEVGEFQCKKHSDSSHFEFRLVPIRNKSNETWLHSEIWHVDRALMVITGYSGGVLVNFTIDLSKQCPSNDGSFDISVYNNNINSTLSIHVSNETPSTTMLEVFCNGYIDTGNINAHMISSCYSTDSQYNDINIENITYNPGYGMKLKLLPGNCRILDSFKFGVGAKVLDVSVNDTSLCSGCLDEGWENIFKSVRLKTDAGREWDITGWIQFEVAEDKNIRSIALHNGFTIKYIFNFTVGSNS